MAKSQEDRINLKVEMATFERTARLIRNFVRNLDKLGDAHRTKATLKGRLKLLDTYWTQCQTACSRIEVVATTIEREELPFFQEPYFDEVEEAYFAAYDYLHDKLAIFEETLPPTSTPTTPTSSPVSPPPIKLAPIDLPTFSGVITEWIAFRDLFTSLIINNPSLTGVQQLHYLLSTLRGDAARLVAHVPLSDANFDVAWSLLVARYNRHRAIVTAHLNQLFAIPVVGSDRYSGLNQLRAGYTEALNALRKLDQPVDSWNNIVVHCIVQKLDPKTRTQWELHIGEETTFPPLSKLTAMIDTQVRALEAVAANPIASGGPSRKEAYASKPLRKLEPRNTVRTHNSVTSSGNCPLCPESHRLNQCKKFRAMKVVDRETWIRHQARCHNCLSRGHRAADCPSAFSCMVCQKRHHSLLHPETQRAANAGGENRGQSANNSRPDSTRTSNDQVKTSSVPDNITTLSAHTETPRKNRSVLLATAWVTVESLSGRTATVRALLDQGSDATFISESLVQTLRLNREATSARIAGIGGKFADELNSIVQFRLRASNKLSSVLLARALVLPRITSYVPERISLPEALSFCADLSLADPDPFSSAPIDLLIGADLYASIMLDGIRKDPAGTMLAQRSIFGWILSGSIKSTISRPPIHVHHTSLSELNDTLKRFWEVEDLPVSGSTLSLEEEQCEAQFAATHSRTPTGRYVVRLPFRAGPPIDIGDSRSIALSSLYRLEKRFSKSDEFRKEYIAFMEDYIQSGHMCVVDSSLLLRQTVYLPHHGVTRVDSATTKLRVVFNASARTQNGKSLNDHLLAGPKLQSELVSLILRWRQWKYVFTADIAQMYRQILVHPEDQSYQLILWRFAPSEPVQTYQLRTVTYGTTSAPYQAQKVILQLTEDEGPNFPLAIPVLRNERYVDDIMSGADNIKDALAKKAQTSDCLARGGFLLRKWASNDPAILTGVDPSNHGFALERPFDLESKLKVLGLCWNPARDEFKIHVSLPPWETPTKRRILSIVAHLFDPLGWLAPVILIPKIILQDLWKRKQGWDEILSDETASRWATFFEQLPNLNVVSIPRWSGFENDTRQVHLQGFCDASEHAYAAVVYLVVATPTGRRVQLLLAKTKVAPVKTLTIPRLELCAAMLLMRCIKSTLQSLPFEVTSIHCWSDSTIVLCWLQKTPSTFKTFVANRIAAIQTELPIKCWKHLPSGDNPADCASRGLLPVKFSTFTLWWQGPSWITSDPSAWPKQDSLAHYREPTDIETKSVITHHGRVQWDLPNRISSWPRLLRVTAYVLRFITRCRYRDVASTNSCLSLDEVSGAHLFLMRHVQREEFAEEYKSLNLGKVVPSGSPLRALDPFLDSSGLIRVGGRLRLSDLPFPARHPVVLPKCKISEIIISQVHRDTVHGGMQLMLRVLRERYWVLGARTSVRSHIHRCVRCVRERAASEHQFMASLPRPRIRMSRPFSHSGVDYAGPIRVRPSSGRGRTSIKTYIAVFVCLATRAIHLELVHDYSASAFIAALERFCARRGLPEFLYSDNGTTFHGAERELRDAFAVAIASDEFRGHLLKDSINWRFLPPAAPHFGGLWEAGVKSVKHHLKRVLGASTPTVEEFLTLLNKIEACLNSRPLAPLKDDVDSFDALTPGHFLIGTALKSVPMPSVWDVPENRLTRWKLMRQKYEQFWKLWSQDYLHTLQQRSKWRERCPNLQPHDFVLIKEPSIPPAKWHLGRVIECFFDSEGLVRSVRIRTAATTLIRPITQLCKLPVSNSPDDNPAASSKERQDSTTKIE